MSPKYKFGYEVPQNIAHAKQLDEAVRNNKWAIANQLEQDQLREYLAFIDRVKYNASKIPCNYKKLKVHTIFDVKYYGHHKDRCVADDHLTNTPVDSMYSGVLSLKRFRMILFISELNGLQPYATDIDNVYLEAHTTEKLWIIVSEEFD